MNKAIRILILEHQPADAELMLRELRRAGYEPEWKQVTTEPDFLAQLDQGWEIILADCQMPQFNGLRALELLKLRGLDIPLVLISGTAGEDLAVQGMKAGANNYLLKDHLARLGQIVKRELRDAAARREHRLEQVALKLSEFSIQHSSLPTYWVASDGRFLRVNEAGCKQLGYTEAELLTLSVADVNPDFTAERWPSHWQELRTRRLMIVETRQRHKDGCIVFVEAELNWFEFEGREYGFAFCRDLTARKQAEAAMRESEERYTALFERSHDCVFICDYTGKFLDANPAALALLGYQRADIATQTFASLLTEDQIARAFQVMEEIKTTGQQRKPAEFKVRHRDGRLIPVETQASLIYREGNPYAIQGIARDLTEHRRTEAALEQERNLLRTLIDHIPDMIYVRDKANRFLTANQSFARRMGVATAADLIGKTDADFYPAELAAQYAARDQKIFAGNELLNYDCVIPFPNGEHLSVLNTKVPLKNAQGEVIGLVGVSHDLTERKQMEQALRDSEAFYHSLVDQMPAGVFRKGPDGRFLFVSRGYCQLKGMKAEEFLGKTPTEAAAEKMEKQEATEQAVKYVAQGEDHHRQVMETGRLIDIIEEYATADGGKQFLHAIKIPVKSADGKIIGTQGILFDITKQKRAEEALGERERQLATLMRNLPGMAYRCRNDQDWTMEFVSAGAQTLTGYSAADLTGNRVISYASLIHPDDRQRVWDEVQAAVKRGEPFVLNYRLRTATGAERWVWEQGQGIFDAQHQLLALEGFITDITERKRAELALESERTLLRTLTDNLPLAVYMKDTAGRKTFINPVDLRNFGVASAAEVLGKTDFDFFPPEQAAAFHADDQHVLDTGQPVLNRVEQITRPDGSIHWTLTSKVPLFDAAGRVTGLAGMGLDITEQKQMELALANERALLRSLVEALPLAVYIKDISGRKTLANPVDLYNQGVASEAEVLGKTDFDMFPPEQAAAFYADDQQVLDGQPVFNREEKLTRPDGTVLCLLTSKVPLRDATGKVTGLAGFGLDITERKNIAEAHDQLALAVEQSAETIVITDPDGTILYTNPAFEKSTGYTRAEALGQNPRMLKSGKQDADFYRRMWETLERGEVWTGHFINQRKDGTLYEEESTISPIRDAAGKVVNYVAVKRDVTREVQLDAQLRQSQKMEAIGQLAGGVAHDFNNILAVIQMQASLLKSGGNLSTEQLEMADEIGTTVERAAALTRQLLLFSRREALQMRDLDLSAAITNLTKMLRRVLGETITVQINLSAQPMFVHADAGMMEQVLLNLAVNARDAMLNGGQLVVSTAGVEFDELSVAQSPSARQGSFVCLSVGDTGCGIPRENLPRIFEPFFTTKDVGKGTGLGLATVFGIVQRHQGWINVYSEVGRGTTFKIYLPRLAGLTARSIAEKMLATPPTGQETILLVEDETALRASVHKILARLGYRILAAPTGAKALAVWKEHHAEIRLLLTDLVMPEGMNGKELAQRLLQENPKLKVIYMSGYSAELADHELSLQEGVNFLAKPFQMQTLAQIIRNRLDQPTGAGEAAET